jgi:transposase
MARRDGAVHVATTIRRVGDRRYETHLLRRTYRDGDRVKHQTLGNISHLPADLIEVVRRGLRGEVFIPAVQALECVRSLPHGHVLAVVGEMHKLGLPSLLASRASPERARVLAMVAARILDPSSKLALSRTLASETASSTLASVLGVQDTTEDELYEALDWLHAHQSRIETKLARRHLEDGSLVLYDLTSTYFEGRTCPLARLGHSRDGRKDKLQIVVGVLTTRQGCPVAAEVFAGNTSDPTTVAKQVEKLRDRFGLSRLILVGDRGMLTAARIREDLATREGLSWITALRSSQIRSLLEGGAVQPSLFDERNLAEVRSPDYPGERLIACRNPLLAAERARKREALLQATEAEFEKIRQATLRAKRALKGAEAIARRAARVENRFKVAKHFHQEVGATSFAYTRRTDSIHSEAALDGIYVIRTDVPSLELDTDETVATYKGLSAVERAFRCMKSITLKLRPIHHRKEERVRAHVFVCMLAYYVEWHLRRAWAPLLFEDHQKGEAAALRTDPVEKARRSPAARDKAASKRTTDGAPVHSLRTLLADLATLVRNRVRPPQLPDAEFDMATIPTPLQRRALDALGVPLQGP